MNSVIDPSILPFGKFYDINGLDRDLLPNLRLIKYEEIEPMEPEFLYLFENEKTNKFYCVWEKDMNLSAGTENVIKDFVGKEYKQITPVAPKNSDWYQEVWMYELLK